MKKIVKRRKPNRSVVGDVVIYFLLFLIALAMVFPLVFAVSSALKPLDELFFIPTEGICTESDNGQFPGFVCYDGKVVGYFFKIHIQYCIYYGCRNCRTSDYCIHGSVCSCKIRVSGKQAVLLHRRNGIDV